MDRINWKHVLLLAVVCIAAFFVHNQAHPIDIMESRNLVTAREMVHEGHWIVPTMNGELRLEKPPLPTWLTAVAEWIAPGQLWGARAVAGLGAVLLVVFFYLLGRNWGGRRYALWSSLVLCTSYPIVLMGRTATWDIWCHAFMLGAIYTLWRFLQASGLRWKWALGFGLLAGLSFLSKGPVSFYALLLPFLIALGVCVRPSLRGRGAALLAGVLVCVVVGGWWYACLHLFHGEELAFVVEKESGAWTNRNVRPWYYYATFFQEAGIWAGVLLTSLAGSYWARRVRDRRVFWMAWIWMVAMVVLLSLLPEKKNRYLLPMLIPAAYTIGCLLEAWVQLFRQSRGSALDRVLFRLNAGLPALLVAILPAGVYWFGYRGGFLSLFEVGAWSVALWAVAAWLVAATRKLRADWLLGSVVLLFGVVEVFFMPRVGQMIGNPAHHGFEALSAKPEYVHTPYYYNEKEPIRIEMVYEAGRTIRPLDVERMEQIRPLLPLILLSHQPVAAELPSGVLEQVDTLGLGCYDNNRRAGRFHRDDFVYYATLLTPKKK